MNDVLINSRAKQNGNLGDSEYFKGLLQKYKKINVLGIVNVYILSIWILLIDSGSYYLPVFDSMLTALLCWSKFFYSEILFFPPLARERRINFYFEIPFKPQWWVTAADAIT